MKIVAPEDEAAPKENNYPSQPIPINIENFYIRTMGVFSQIQIIPEEFVEFYQSKGSIYYTNPENDTIIRSSDHWGSYIRYCAWFLKDYRQLACFAWQKTYGNGTRIGIIKLSELKENPVIYKLDKKKVKPLPIIAKKNLEPSLEKLHRYNEEKSRVLHPHLTRPLTKIMKKKRKWTDSDMMASFYAGRICPQQYDKFHDFLEIYAGKRVRYKFFVATS